MKILALLSPFARAVTPRVGITLSLLAGALTITGCGAGSPAGPAPVTQGAISGVAFGGDQPIIGANVTVWAAGTSGYGVAVSKMKTAVTVTTGAGGGFNLTGTYTCNPTDLMYITVTGGNSGAGTNTAINLMEALGPCQNYTASTFLTINEVTTAAAAYALNQFMSAPDGNLYSTQIGTSSTNVIGLTNAFVTANTLANTATGTSPGTVAYGATVPATMVNTVADMIASCVNSTGTTCTGTYTVNTTTYHYLLTGATPGTSTAAKDTLQAAEYIVQNPTNLVADLFNLVTATPPFPALPGSPADFTAEITYTGSNAAGASFNNPEFISADSQGNIWVINNGFVPTSTATTNNGANFVTELSNNGTLLSGTAGFASTQTAFTYPRGLAIDLNDNAWITNDGSISGTSAGGSQLGPANSNLIFSISSTGTTSSLQTGTSAGTALEQPYGTAIDGSGNVFFGSQTLKQLGVITGGISSPAYAAPASGKNTIPSSSFPPAADSTGGVWVPSNSTTGLYYIASPAAGTGSSAKFTTSPLNVALYAVAVDNSNNVWVDTSTVLYNVSTTGTVNLTCTLPGTPALRYMAVDGAGNVWVTNVRNPGNVVEFNKSCTGMTGSVSLGVGNTNQPAVLLSPRSIAVDSSGNVWAANNITGGTTIVEIVGVGAPTVTPISKALKLGKVGQLP